jgi:hypothetical protein
MKDKDQDTDQARGTPVLPPFTVSKMTQCQGQGQTWARQGPGHVPDPELGHGQGPVPDSVQHKSCYQTLDCDVIMHSYVHESNMIQAQAGIGTPPGAGRRGSHFPFAPPQTKGPGPVMKSGTYTVRGRDLVLDLGKCWK